MDGQVDYEWPQQDPWQQQQLQMQQATTSWPMQQEMWMQPTMSGGCGFAMVDPNAAAVAVHAHHAAVQQQHQLQTQAQLQQQQLKLLDLQTRQLQQQQMQMQQQQMAAARMQQGGAPTPHEAAGGSPGSAAVTQFMKQLGIMPGEEADLAWVAELGLQSPVPPGWECHQDPSTGYTFYVDTATQASTWENPLTPALQKVVEVARTYLDMPSPTENFFAEQKELLWQDHKGDLESWHGPYTANNGSTYFVNSSTGVTSATDPREDTQYIYDLQCSFLDSLAEVLPPPGGEPGTPGRHWGGADTPSRAPQPPDILVLDDVTPPLSPVSAGVAGETTPRRRLNALMSVQVDHKSTFDKMRKQAELLWAMQSDEHEVQRLALAKHAKRRKAKLERRQRQEQMLESRRTRPAPQGVDDGGSEEDAQPEVVRDKASKGRVKAPEAAAAFVSAKQLESPSARLVGGLAASLEADAAPPEADAAPPE